MAHMKQLLILWLLTAAAVAENPPVDATFLDTISNTTEMITSTPETTSVTTEMTTSGPNITTSTSETTTSSPEMTTSIANTTSSISEITTSTTETITKPMTTADINVTTGITEDTSTSASATIDTTTSTPDTATSTPDTATSTPDTATSTPNTATSIPDTATSTPNTATSIPDTATSTPDTATSIPDTATSTPNTATSIPDTATSTPDTATSTPDTATSTPDTATSTPNTATSIPDTATSTPNTATSIPDTATSTPDTATSTPDTATSTPNTATSIPDTATSTPETTSAEATTITTTTAKPGPCELNPCPQQSKCEERFGNHTCLCLPGLFYNELLNTCFLARTFPSNLRFNAVYEEDMSNTASKVFQDTANEIIKGISETFSKTEFQSLGYIGSTVLSLRPGSVIADVQNFFEVASDVTTDSVTQALNNVTINGNPVNIDLSDTCSTGYCGTKSTKCSFDNGLSTCTCLPGHIESKLTNRECIACLSGEQSVDSKECKACPFGYSGFNCDESYLLIVVIVSTVLGSLLLSSLVAIIFLNFRKPQKGGVSSDDNEELINMEICRPTGIPRVPRANAYSGWQPTNLEAADSGEVHKTGDTNSLVTKDRPERTAVERYNDSSSDDTGRYKSHLSSRNEKDYGNRNPYGNGNGNGYGYGVRATSGGSRGTSHLYYDPDDEMPRKY